MDTTSLADQVRVQHLRCPFDCSLDPHSRMIARCAERDVQCTITHRSLPRILRSRAQAHGHPKTSRQRHCYHAHAAEYRYR